MRRDKPETFFIGWSRRDLVWLKAALTLPAYDFLLACEDISSMSGRTVAAVCRQAKKMRADAKREAEKPKAPAAQLSVEMICIRPLTMTELMAGKARNRYRKPDVEITSQAS